MKYTKGKTEQNKSKEKKSQERGEARVQQALIFFQLTIVMNCCYLSPNWCVIKRKKKRDIRSYISYLALCLCWSFYFSP
jgi:hypothetical protein